MVISVLSIHPEDAYDVLAINAASLSTQLSGLPFSGPVASVRIALIEKQWVAFPRYEERANATFDMVVAGRIVGDDVAIAMIEAEAPVGAWDLIGSGATAPSESVVAEGIEAAKPFIRVLCDAQADLAARAAKETQDFPVFPEYTDDVYAAVEGMALGKLEDALGIADKQDRENRLDEIKDETRAALAEQFEGREKEISAAVRAVTKKVIRRRILTDGFRIDGRGPTDIRSLSAEVDVLARVHGSALFERGETQILGVTTLAMLRMEQMIDSLSPETRKRYMHNYNFPPYSTGETGRVGTPKRREIGHGALAERAILPVLPSRE